ncbi:MAG: Ig-like domain-containing protein, partial [Pseudohongiella sp.]|nr:Ig-like domain-containing protein [Pseudohongiella sp.]
VSGFTNADLSIANGTLTDVASADGGITWTATLTPTADLNDTTNIITLANTGVSDAAGNAGTGTTSSNNYVIDTLRPTASIVVADTALGAGETSAVTITFNEAVTGFTNADLSIANGTLTDVATVDGGITWTATLTPTADVTDTSNFITLTNSGVSDNAGNAGTGTTNSNNYAVDTLRPTATIVVADTSLKAGETSLVTITFNEAVTGFTTADLTVENGTVANISSLDGGITWTKTLTPTVNITDTTNIITLNNTGVIDAAGNTGLGTTGSNNYEIDTAPPTLTSSSPTDDATSVLVNSNIVLTFSETVTAGSGNIVISDGSHILTIPVADAQVTINGTTVTINPTAHLKPNSLYFVQMAAGVLVDAAGNPYAGIADTTTLNFTTGTDTLTINPDPGALTLADKFWTDVNGIDKVVITTTATGTQSIVTGDSFNKAFAEGVELSTTSSTGTILIDMSSYTTGAAKLTTVSSTGNQTILGSVNADNVTVSTYAATGNIISTGAGNDVITIINTGDANGSAYVITGGLGADTINLDTAQVSPDTVVIGDNDSGITLLTADKITGFNGAQDSLKMGTAATAGNFVVVTAPVADFNAALAAANTALATLANGAEKYAFAWDATNGYVFNDTNGDSVADQVVILVGINNAQFAMADIIA